MYIDFLSKVFEEHANDPAIVWRDATYSYRWLQHRLTHWQSELASRGIEPGSVLILEADFSPNAVALFLAAIERRCVLVPLTKSVGAKRDEFVATAQGTWTVELDDADEARVSKLPYVVEHPLLVGLRGSGRPGLILFSSGSTGTSKAAVHDLSGILAKFETPRQRLCAITFLLYDHIGGVNTMLYQLANGGCIVTVADRTPDAVLEAVQQHRVELLPTSPTFLNLILLSEAYARYDLRSLRLVTYGTEPMPESTLKRFHELFPEIRLQQTYGLSEVGILRSKSKSSDSLWIKVGGEGFETRVVDGILQVKAKSAMLGYLNAPSPFVDGGWFDTSDLVEQDGEYIRILGRKSEVINVGGEKVFPAEVESVLLELADIADATVYPEKNAITGNIVCVRVSLKEGASREGFAARLREHCRGRLQKFKVPVKVRYVETAQHGSRFKKLRNLCGT